MLLFCTVCNGAAGLESRGGILPSNGNAYFGKSPVTSAKKVDTAIKTSIRSIKNQCWAANAEHCTKPVQLDRPIVIR